MLVISFKAIFIGLIFGISYVENHLYYSIYTNCTAESSCFYDDNSAHITTKLLYHAYHLVFHLITQSVQNICIL